jgi:hypothetical protein
MNKEKPRYSEHELNDFQKENTQFRHQGKPEKQRVHQGNTSSSVSCAT